MRNSLLQDIYTASKKGRDQLSFGIEEIKIFHEGEKEKGYFVFKADKKRIGIKFKEKNWGVLERIEKFRKGVAIASSFVLAIFIVSLPILILLPSRKTFKRVEVEEGILLSLGEMLSKMKLRENELLKIKEVEEKKVEELRVISHVILNSLPFPLLLISPDNRILNMNRTGEDFFKTSITSSLYRPSSSILSTKMLEIIDEANKKWEKEERVIFENGKWLWISITPIKKEREPIGLIFMLKDITEEKREEEILKEKEKMASLGEMASYLAHEIKNSINIATGFLKLSQKKEDHSEKAIKELHLVLENIERFLDFARPLKVKKEEIILKDIIHEIVESFEGIDFDFRGEFPVIKGDRDLLKIVFSNLIKNSIEASSSKILFESHWKNGERKALIDVVDNGKGIPEDKIEKIFLPFFSTKEKGAGLGLSLSKKIILHHGGEILAIPTKKGAKIRIILEV